jgi:3-deoxy-7-phosphoheptulonate synthase
VAAGAAGLIVEVHPNPDRALSDGFQSLYPEQFKELAEECRAVADLLRERRAKAEALLAPVL